MINKNDFSRRNFISVGAAVAASSLATGVAAKGFNTHEANSKGMLNVIDFGAKGDGETDDTEAIQKALDAAGLVNGSVFIPEGTFLTSELKVPEGIGIHGLPAWSYRNGMGTILKLKDENAKCLLNITFAYGVYLYGLCLHGNDLGEGIHGIMVDKPDYGKQEDTPRIDTCRVEHFTGDGIRLERIWCFCVRHSHCMRNLGCGMRMRGWDGFVLDNWFSGNRMAGYGAYDENNATTVTGNRIEWNHQGGIVLHGGSHYNITGNYVDRSGRAALALLPGKRGQRCHTLAVTGNVLYRSGKPDWDKTDEFDSSHARFENVSGLSFTGNAFTTGRDDGGQGSWSPNYGIVMKGLDYSVIADNVLYNGMLKQMIVDQGEHGEELVVKNNVGCIRKLD
ncbi:glycosyl hydrolase family 28-related protein [Bacteroidota bacterium]